MGMDIYAERFKALEGWPPSQDYFRASCWSWRPIEEAIEVALRATGRRELDDDERQILDYNDGALIPADRAVEIADALEEWIALPANEGAEVLTLHRSPRYGLLRKVDPRGEPTRKDYGGTIVDTFPLESEDMDTGRVYTTDLDHLREFARFARSSGGFRVR